jgi:hypothetical protein
VDFFADKIRGFYPQLAKIRKKSSPDLSADKFADFIRIFILSSDLSGDKSADLS